MSPDPEGVRPTKRCLADLDMSPPDLGHPLDELDHPVVAIAQTGPAQRDAGGVQRILSLHDRVWFKVKTGAQRAVVTQLRNDDLPGGARRVVAWRRRVPPGRQSTTRLLRIDPA